MNRWVLMIVINVFLLIAGCFLPPVAIILMLCRSCTPVLEANNFDLIWFAVMMTINLEIGLITPPVGLNLYVLRGVAPEVPLPHDPARLDAVRLHHAGVHGGAVRLPGLATWLPDTLMGTGR